MKLRPNEVCPLHRRRNCCGRKSIVQSQKCFSDWITVGPGIKRNRVDGRERRSPAAMKRLLAEKIQEQRFLCGICGEQFTDVQEIVPDHILPRGMGGARRDDRPSNIQAAHSTCNNEKGSKRA